MNIKLLFSALLFPLFSLAQSPVWVQIAHPDSLQVNSVVFSGDGQSVLCGTNCHPAKIRRFNTSDGVVSWDYTVSLNLNCMMSVALSSNERYFTSAEENGNLMLFDYSLAEPTLVQTLPLGSSYAFSVDFSPNSDKLVVGCSGNKLKCYTINGTQLWNVTAHSTWVTAVDYAPDGRYIASGGSDNKVKIWDTTGVLIKTLAGHSNDISAVKFSADGQRLVSSSQDKTVRVWDWATGALLQKLTFTEAVPGIALSADGKYLAAVAGEMIHIIRLSDFNPAFVIPTYDAGTPTAIAWSPGAAAVAVGTANGKIALYDLSQALTPVYEAGNEFNAEVWPNPFNDRLQLRWPADERATQVEIFDMSGVVLQSKVIPEGLNYLQLPLPATIPPVAVLQLHAVGGRSFRQVILRN